MLATEALEYGRVVEDRADLVPADLEPTCGPRGVGAARAARWRARTLPSTGTFNVAVCWPPPVDTATPTDAGVDPEELADLTASFERHRATVTGDSAR
jgi:hypothetical protein